MNPLLSYLLQMMAASGLLYGYYHFALKNNNFHKYNRYYLLISAIISLVVPFLNIPLYFTESETQSSVVLQALTIFTGSGTDEVTITSTKHWDFTNWFSTQTILRFIYLIVLSVSLLRIAISLAGIRKLAKANTVEKFGNIHFVNTDEPGTPFSFFRWLFWNKKIELHSEKGEQIFRHELYHIEQRHSLDIISLEILTALCWFNPFFHLIKKETKAIHEFLADQFSIKENNKWQYAELLLMQVLNTNQSLVNPFFHNQIKRRIAMITTSTKPSYRYLRKIMVLPIAALVIGLFAFTYKKKEILKNDISNKDQFSDTTKPNRSDLTVKKSITIASPKRKLPTQEQLNSWTNSKIYGVWLDEHRINNNELSSHKPSDFALWTISKLEKNAINYGKHYYQVNLLTEKNYLKNYPKDSMTFFYTHIEKKDTGKPVSVDNKIFTKIEIDPAFSGGDVAWRNYLQKNLNATVPVDSGAKAGTYTVIVQFIVDKNGGLSEIKPLTRHGFGMEDEVVRIIKASPKWKPAIQNGKVVTAYKKQPVTFVIQEELPVPDKTKELPQLSLAELKSATVGELTGVPADCVLIEFRFSIDLVNGVISEAWNKGNDFSSEVKRLISNASAGRLVTIDDIKVIKDGRERKIPSQVYTITN
jgi:hypothetical protein